MIRSLLILGGARSGKTRLALMRAEASALRPVYVATAAAWDDEMRERIARHRAERDQRWTTIEEAQALAPLLEREAQPGRVLLIDCLTLWLSNLLLAEMDCDAAGDALCASIARAAGPVILVSNEVGLGIVPDNALARRFRDLQGRLNQSVASVCDEVVFVAAGLPLTLKAPGP
jgi:adenosylcobinamide kinase / adenosylcobinamide-phosphate guanylyltransferase